MRRTLLTLTTAAMLAASSLMAGGFWLQLGNPEASAEAQKANAVVTIVAAGCSDPAKAEITATAIGFVDGKRKSIPLSVTKLSKPGMFGIAQQWPKEGKWVIQMEGRSDGHVTTTLVTASPQGVDRLHAKSEMRAFASKEVESLLQ